MLRCCFGLEPQCRDRRLEIRFELLFFLQASVLMEMACEEARQAGRVVWWRCAGTSGESVDQEAEQSGAGGSAHEGNKI